MRDIITQISLVFSLLLGALSVITKGQDFLLQIYWAPEILLTLCVIGLVVVSSMLIWAKKRQQGFPGFTIVPRYSRAVRMIGAIVIVAAPLTGFAIWYSTFRISDGARQEITALVESGDISASTTPPHLFKARDFYSQALSKDPRRTDIRKKLEEINERLKGTNK